MLYTKWMSAKKGAPNKVEYHGISKYMMSPSTAISQLGVTDLQLMILVDTASVIEKGNRVPSNRSHCFGSY